MTLGYLHYWVKQLGPEDGIHTGPVRKKHYIEQHNIEDVVVKHIMYTVSQLYVLGIITERLAQITLHIIFCLIYSSFRYFNTEVSIIICFHGGTRVKDLEFKLKSLRLGKHISYIIKYYKVNKPIYFLTLLFHRKNILYPKPKTKISVNGSQYTFDCC